MDLYIKDMEIPKEGFVEILVRDDGTVQQTGQSYRIDGTDYYTPYIGEVPVIYKAVPVPPHGRLIDADAFTRRIKEEEDKCATTGCKADRYLIPGYRATTKFANDFPTVIPASEEG